MSTAIRLIVLLIIVDVAFGELLLNGHGNQTSTEVDKTTLKRAKRFLGFKPNSRFFFRINIKDNVYKQNQIFAHSYGFRQNYDILYPQPKSYKVRRRDVHETVETLLNHHGFDGRACILRTFCVASKIATPESGIVFKLFRKIFTLPTDSDVSGSSVPNGDAEIYPYLKSDDCDELERHCPLSLLEMSPYTDID